MQNERETLSLLKTGSKEAFSKLFRHYYKDLVLFAGTFIPNKSVCEDIIQTVFFKIWQQHETLNIKTSFKSFLTTSVRNACLDEIRHSKIKNNYTDSFEFLGTTHSFSTQEYILYSDLQKHLTNAIENLPEECKETFKLNKLQGLKYREIAQELNVSERTVEVRIGKSLKLLKAYLKDFLITIFVFINTF